MLNFRIVPLPGWSIRDFLNNFLQVPLFSVHLICPTMVTLLFVSDTSSASFTFHYFAFFYYPYLALFWSLLRVVFIVVAFPLPLWFSDSIFLNQFYFSNSLHETLWLTGSFPYFQSEKVLLTLMNKELIFVWLKGKELSVCDIKDYNGLPFVSTL